MTEKRFLGYGISIVTCPSIKFNPDGNRLHGLEPIGVPKSTELNTFQISKLEKLSFPI